MRKRLRKKLRLGEFREFCFPISFETPALSNADREQLCDDFLEFLEANRLAFGGRVHDKWNGIVQFEYRGTATEEHRQLVRAWLNGNPQITEVQIGELVDAWHSRD